MKKVPLTVFGIVVGILVGAFIVQKTAQAPTDIPTTSPPTSVRPSVSPTASPANITISSPVTNAVVGNPITVIGKARVFEGVFQYALRDTSGEVLFQSNGLAGAPDANGYRNFSVKIPVPVGAPSDLVVEIFEYSAKDGSIINLVRIPVRLATAQTSTVQVFLHNRRLNSNDSCDVVFPVTRTIIKTNEPAYMAVHELLKGPIGSEKDDQYYSSLPEGVKINSLKITNGTAFVDFNNTLEYQVGGSCRVLAIRTQITNTLKQFSNIRNVVISIDGRIGDILQP